MQTLKAREAGLTGNALLPLTFDLLGTPSALVNRKGMERSSPNFPTPIRVFSISQESPHEEATGLYLEVTDGLSLAGGAKAAVSEFKQTKGAYPVDNPEAGVADPTEISGKYASAVTIANGLITVTYSGGQAHKNLTGKTLELSPISNVGSIDWTCKAPAGGVDSKYLPSSCRR